MKSWEKSDLAACNRTRLTRTIVEVAQVKYGNTQRVKG
jgi:hypothetical protein